MHQFASGSSAAVSLLGGESGPPVGPETVGRPPSGFEAPPIPSAALPDGGAREAPAETQPEAESPAGVPTADVPAVAEVRRLVVRLLGGDEVELGNFDERDGAIEAAQIWSRVSARRRPRAIGPRSKGASCARTRRLDRRTGRRLGGPGGTALGRSVPPVLQPGTPVGADARGEPLSPRRRRRSDEPAPRPGC